MKRAKSWTAILLLAFLWLSLIVNTGSAAETLLKSDFNKENFAKITLGLTLCFMTFNLHLKIGMPTFT